MYHSKTLLVTTLLAIATAITGCQSTTQQTGQTNNMTEQTATPQALSRYSWQLVSAVDNHNQPLTALTNIKDQVRLDFGQQNGQNLTRFTVGCNNLGAQYSLTNNVLNINNIRQTMMGCGELSGAESLLNGLMQGSSQLVFKNTQKPLLTQITSNHSTLVWQGTLTPQAQFNQQGETVFWEVNHQASLCSESSTKVCLKVRPIHYNEQGIKTEVGQWTVYGGTIQGYTHDATTDEILRLKRFMVEPSDVKGKHYAYVLDTVVESTLVQ